jgi:hypothetical protein
MTSQELVIGICVALLLICGLSSMFVWNEMVAQIQAQERTFQVSQWGRPSFSEQAKVLRTHRLHYPASRLRKAYWLLSGGIFVPFALILSLALIRSR